MEPLGFVRCPPALRAHAFPKIRHGVTGALREVENLAAAGQTRVEVLYIQPIADPAVTSIGFDTLAPMLAGRRTASGASWPGISNDGRTRWA